MGVSIVLNIDNKTRFDIGVASKICGEDYINLSFSRDTLTIIGYSNSSFCLCKEYINNNVNYNFRLHKSIMKSLVQYSKVKFNIDGKVVTLSGFTKDGKHGNEIQVKLNTDTTVSYQMEFFNDLIDSLRSGFNCNTLESLKNFVRVSKINSSGERGVMISDGVYFTAGEGYRFFTKTEFNFECFLLTNDLINLIDFVGTNDNIIYQQGGYIVVKNANDCYFGVRVADVDDSVSDLDIVMKQTPLSTFKYRSAEMKSILRPIEATKTNDGKITIKPQDGLIVVGLPESVYKIPFDFKDVIGEEDIVLNFKLFNRLIQTVEGGTDVTVNVYNRFISLMYGGDTILLISKS